MIPRHEQPTPGKAALLGGRISGEVPEVRTARLLLRAPRIEDFATYADILCGPRAAHVGGPLSRPDAWADFTNYVAGWMLHGHGSWTITDTRGRDVIGFVMVGLEPGDHEPELGYLMTEAAEGNGYAFEAATEARTFALSTLRLPSLVSYIAPGNTRSIALAEKLGAVRDGAAEAAIDHDILVYRHVPDRRITQ